MFSSNLRGHRFWYEYRFSILIGYSESSNQNASDGVFDHQLQFGFKFVILVIFFDYAYLKYRRSNDTEILSANSPRCTSALYQI